MPDDPTNPCLSIDLGDFNVVDEALVGAQGEKGDPGVAALAKATKETTADMIRHLNLTVRNYIDERTVLNPAYFTSPERVEATDNLYLMLDEPVHDQVQELLAFHGLLDPENAVERAEVPAGVVAARRAGEEEFRVDAPDHLWAVPPKFVNEIVTNWAGTVSDVRFAEVPSGVYFCLVADAGAHANQYYNVVEQVWNGAAWVAKAGGLAVAAENMAERTLGTHLLPDGELVIVERSKTQAGAWVYGFCRRVIAWNPLAPPNYAEITNGAPGAADLATYDAAGALTGERRILARFPNAPVRGANVIGVRVPQIGWAANIVWPVGGTPASGNALEVHLYLITSDFDPATVTWATQPPVAEIVSAPGASHTDCQFYTHSDDASSPSATGGQISLGWHNNGSLMFDYVNPTGMLTPGTDYYGVELRGNITSMAVGPWSGNLYWSLPAWPSVMYRS